jgi:hypothetical protein
VVELAAPSPQWIESRHLLLVGVRLKGVLKRLLDNDPRHLQLRMGIELGYTAMS